MHAFVFAIQRLLAMLFCLVDNYLNNFPIVPIAILKVAAFSCFMYFRVSRELSSIPTKLYMYKHVQCQIRNRHPFAHG